jgi:hypothetical protein
MNEGKADETMEGRWEGKEAGRNLRATLNFISPFIYVLARIIFPAKISVPCKSCRGRQKPPKHAAHSDVNWRRQIIFCSQ